MAKKKLIIANWKLYIEKPEEAKQFARALRLKTKIFSRAVVVVAPSYPLIPVVAAALKGSPLKIGAQAVSSFTGGAHTGYVSGALLKNSGVSYAIIGHSERRAQVLDGVQAAGETDEVIAAQLRAAIAAKLIPVLCVGEREREQSGAHFSVIENQLRAALTGLPKKGIPLVIAYEPVWAIGKTAAEAMKPADMREMAIFIKKTLAGIFERTAALHTPILYGGSVEEENAAALISEAEIDGFLIGHASAAVSSFAGILKACQ